MTLKWHGPQVKRALKLGMRQRLALFAQAWVKYAKQQLSMKINRDGSTPSKGGYPAMVTSNLRGKIEWEQESKLAVRVGTNVEYGKFLELKTGKGKRPWMTLTNKATIGVAKRIFGRKFKFTGGK